MSKVSIVVTSWGSVPMTDRYIRGMELSLEGFEDWNGYVVYEKEDIETVNYLKNLPETHPHWSILGLDPPPKGHAYAADKGFEFARLQNPDAEYIAKTEYCDIASIGWLQKIIKIFEKDEHIGIVGPMSYPRNDWPTSSLLDVPESLIKEELVNSKEMFDYVNKREPEMFYIPVSSDVATQLGLYPRFTKEQIEWIFFAWEAFLVFRRQCYDEVGLYLKNWPNHDERGFSSKAQSKGWKIVSANKVHYWKCGPNCDSKHVTRGPAHDIRGSDFA